MNFYILTLFPEMIENGLNHSIIKRALKKEIISINAIDIRNFSENKHKKVDDYAYGGGAGMIMKPEPIFKAFLSLKNNIKKDKARILYMTPQGKPFNQKMAEEFSKEDDLIILCGHYEGIDERVIEEIVTDEISIGDFILTGGEIPAMAIIDSISRLIPDVLGKEESFINESFSENLLEYPNYTRPFSFNGKEVPSVLISGNHKKIADWKREQSLIRTYKKRPDLLKSANLTKKEKTFLKNEFNYELE